MKDRERFDFGLSEGEGGYVFDTEKGEIVCHERTMLGGVMPMMRAMNHATDEELERFLSDAAIRRGAFEAGKRMWELCDEIIERENLYPDRDGEED